MITPALAFAAAVAALAGAADLLAAAQRARLGVLAWRLAQARVAPSRPSPGDEGAGRQSSLGVLSHRRGLGSRRGGGSWGWWCSGCSRLAGSSVGVALGAVVALGGPAAGAAMLRRRRGRYVEAVQAGAAAAALALASALACGHSVRGAIAEAAGDLEGPAGIELRAAARALELGEGTDAVLECLRLRAGGGPWDTLTAAILLQRDAGGDLAGLLRDLACSLDAADRARRDARAATAQSRLTAWIVASLPAGAAVLAELGSPGFLVGLLADPLSAGLTIAAVGLDLAAILTIRRLARVST